MGNSVSIKGTLAGSPAVASKEEASGISGKLYPTFVSSDPSLITSLAPSLSTATLESVAASIGLGTGGAVSFFRSEVPWKSIAEWTHKLPKTPTDQWMDVVDGAVRGPNHRWLRHHPYDFAKAWWQEEGAGKLNWFDYFRHGFLDSITIKGLPLLPQAVHTKLLALGIPADILFKWTHLNVFDITVGALSVAGGGTHLVLAIAGHLPWGGTETFMLTFGLGALQVAGGIFTSNPFLVAGGAMDITAGALSYWQHVHVPDESLLSTLLPGILAGGIVGCVVTAGRLGMSWKETTLPEKLMTGSETMGLCTLLSTLSTVSPWLSIPLGVAFSAGKLAFSMGRNANDFCERSQLSSDFTPVLSRAALFDAGGQDAVDSFEKYLSCHNEHFHDEKVADLLKTTPDWSHPPRTAEHVFGLRDSISW